MPYKLIVRYGSMGLMGTFISEIESLRRGDKVVIRTDRGSEVGEVVNPNAEEPAAEPAGAPAGATTEEQPAAGGEQPAPIESVPVAEAPAPHEAEAKDAGPKDEQQPNEGKVLRRLTAEDEAEVRRLRDSVVPGEMAFCRDRIKLLNLPMKLVDAEHLLGGEKIIFYFLADGRVDFRQLVKDIAREYKTRIELRQIGVRDEARLLAELGHCGQCLCCRSFMKSLEPVTMRMAKSQKATLDPTKISGVCGRLMCCLRYEDRVYSELKAKLPKRGVMVTTRKAAGKVVDVDVLSQMLTLRTPNSNIVRVSAKEVISIDGTPQAPQPDEADAQEHGCQGGDCASRECPRREGEQNQGAQREGERREGGRPEGPRREGGRREGGRRDDGRRGPGGERRGGGERKEGGERREGGERKEGGDRRPQGERREGPQGGSGQQRGQGQGQGPGQGRPPRRGPRRRGRRGGNGNTGGPAGPPPAA